MDLNVQKYLVTQTMEHSFFTQTFYGNTLLDWLTSLTIIAGAFLLSKIIYLISSKFLRKLTAKTTTNLDDILIDNLEKPIVFAIILIGILMGINRLDYPTSVYSIIQNGYTFLIVLNATWFIARICDALMEEYLKPLTERTTNDFDDQIYPIAKKCLSYIIWSIGIIMALNNAGYDVGAVIAGLGIGGLALAMAAKDTVANFFGGFTIFSDKPFRIGDRVKIAGYDGFIHEIGLRSFRLRTLNGTIVAIPNSKVTDSLIENITLEPSRKIVLNLGLTYETTPQKVQEAMDILREIASHHPSLEENVVVSFNQYGDFSLGIIFIYYIRKGENTFQTQSDINLSILTRFNEAGIQFAYPTQTLYVNKGV